MEIIFLLLSSLTPLCYAILNGVPTTILRVPFVTYISGFSTQQNKYVGFTGLIVHPWFVLTSGKWCNSDMSNIHVAAGNTRISQGGISVDQIFLHPEMDPKWFDMSACLLLLSRNLTLGPKIQVAVLADQDEPIKENAKFNVVGWGATKPLKESAPFPEYVHHGITRFVSNIECSNYYSRFLKKDMFCFGYLDRPDRTMKGDEGGPVYDESNGKVYGIIRNFNDEPIDNEPHNLPQFGNLVSYWRNWLEETIIKYG